MKEVDDLGIAYSEEARLEGLKPIRTIIEHKLYMFDEINMSGNSLLKSRTTRLQVTVEKSNLWRKYWWWHGLVLSAHHWHIPLSQDAREGCMASPICGSVTLSLPGGFSMTVSPDNLIKTLTSRPVLTCAHYQLYHPNKTYKLLFITHHIFIPIIHFINFTCFHEILRK